MASPYDHNQLATLSSMDITFDAESETFVLERTFDFSDSPFLEAEGVASTWREMLAESPKMGGEIIVNDEKMTLRFESGGVKTRHDLKPEITMAASEMILMLATHDTDQAVGVAEHLLQTAEKADDMMD